MAGFRPTGNNGCFTDTFINAGDTLLAGEFVGVLSNAAGVTIPAANLLSGILSRQGATAANFSDTTDTAANILAALSAGENATVPMAAVGTTFRVRMLNTTGFTQTLLAGTGVTLATGTFTTPTVSFRDYLVTITNATSPEYVAANTVNGTTAVTFILAQNTTSLPMGPSPLAVNITAGMSVSGTGIAAGTTVVGVTMGQGGVVGCTLSANATATGVTGLTFTGTVKIDSIGSGLI